MPGAIVWALAAGAVIVVLLAAAVVGAAGAAGAAAWRRARLRAAVGARGGAKGGAKGGGAALRPFWGPPPPGLAGRAAAVDAFVEGALAAGDFGPPGSVLGRACALALRGGKRARGAVALGLAEAAAPGGAGAPAAAEAALAVECLHAASLVIDDHPDFDDDAERRGRPAVHAALGGAAAQMAAVALVAGAFRGLCRLPLAAAAAAAALAAETLGGAAEGQLLDMEPAAGPEGAARVAALKTASFFELAAGAGWLAGGGGASGLAAAREVGGALGTAFQLADDLGDLAQDAARAARGKPGQNFAAAAGAAAAAAAVEAHLARAREGLVALGAWGPFWAGGVFPLVRGMAAPPPGPKKGALGALCALAAEGPGPTASAAEGALSGASAAEALSGASAAEGLSEASAAEEEALSGASAAAGLSGASAAEGPSGASAAEGLSGASAAEGLSGASAAEGPQEEGPQEEVTLLR